MMDHAYACTCTFKKSLMHETLIAFGLSAGAVAIATGYVHTCALLADGSIKCWGDNGLGQLGTGDTTNRNTPTCVVGLQAGAIERRLRLRLRQMKSQSQRQDRD